MILRLLVVLVLISSHLFAAETPILSTFDRLSLRDLPNLLVKTRLEGCGTELSGLAADLAQHLRAIHRRDITDSLISNVNTPGRPFVDLRGNVSGDYFKPLSQYLNGYVPATSHIPEEVRNYVSVHTYGGKDLSGNVVAMLRGGQVETKDKGPRPKLPGVQSIYPEWQREKDWLLDDIFVEPESLQPDHTTERALFKRFVRSATSQSHLERLVAFSNDPKRSEMLELLGFVELNMPTAGVLYVQRGSSSQAMVYETQAALGTRYYVYLLNAGAVAP